MDSTRLLILILLTCLFLGCTDPGWICRDSGISSVAPMGFGLWGVCFSDADAATAVGYEGIIIRTTDGGDSWYSQTSGTGNSLQGVCFSGTMHGWVVGRDIILHTKDGGDTWIRQGPGTYVSFEKVFCLDTSLVWAVGSDMEDNAIILHTENGGATWTRQRTGLKTNLFDVYFSDQDTGTAVGGWCGNCTGSPLYGGYILHTTDGGTTWNIQYHDTTIIGYYGVFLADAGNGIVVGASGTILRTINGGAKWTRQPSGTTSDLRDVCFSDASTGTAVGGEVFYPYQGGTVIRTTDSGITWKRQEIPVHNILLSVSVTDAGKGIVVGYNIVLNTRSGGESLRGRSDPYNSSI